MKCNWLPFFLGLILASSANTSLFAQNSVKKKILVVGFKITQFNSNVYYVDELAFLNGSTKETVIDLYNQTLTQTLNEYSGNSYRFISPDSSEVASLHARSNYVEWKNEYKEPYLALDSDSLQNLYLTNLMRKYEASYLLSINYYNIFRNTPPAFYTDVIKVKHIIDYEVFTPGLQIASAGQITFTTTNSRAKALKGKYSDFTNQLIARLKIYEGNYTPEVAEKKYMSLKEQLVKNTWGAGLSLGWGSAYGAVGVELTRFLGNRWDVNTGIGFGPSGFKAGAGLRYYLLNYGGRYKPFFEVNYAWASGIKEFDMGGEKDDSGNQLYPEKVSTFKIPSAQAVHLKTGFRWLRNNKAWLLSVGYAIPFKGNKAEVVSSGNDVSVDTFNRRKRWANLFTVGGVDVGIAYIIYFSR